jgi:hypothetical protein
MKGSMYLRQACTGPTNITCAEAAVVGGSAQLTATVASGTTNFLWVDSATAAASGQFLLEVSML